MSPSSATGDQPARPILTEVTTPSGPPITIDVRVRLQALAVPEPGGGYSVIVPALPGCVTEGDDLEEVRAHIVEAAEGWLAVAHDRDKDEALGLVRVR